ncbi:RecQ family ATP-dependent DNA helicase [Kocuria rhizophila]|uniref:RecQ family ATP-dependent DNA helicase n=1 Tax=Kocuria rhizophila TaxID=72000 RepID=UPI000C87A7E0|nr:RecQ family ATP-dependent DNA helicase [Kocuria rhizophila]MCT1957630.1 RecQ family ATP-dependent DNA helicase [Kocuria rhizophila]MCT2073672.1 RecQ family ATP-dependent DNA helicase [Kocuria rhizophila]PMR90909.1 recombinase RecQ [Kocuria rhizophila]
MTPSEPSTPSDLRARALGHLRDLTGNPSADFHPGQFEAVLALVEGHRRALVVQRTGWGKSAVYFLSALLMRAQGYGPTLIISPLLALMRDQVSAAQRAGVRAAAISSANPTEWAEISSALDRGEVDVLLVSPERLNNPRFRDEQLPQLMDRLGLLVVDEAHCISDWGHDFRPDYRRIKDMLAQLPDSVAVLATTATANERVIEDVREQLGVGSGYGGEVFTLRGPLSRASLRLGVLRLPSTSARLAWLLAHLDELPGSGIIYALTIGAAEDTAQALTDAGHRVAAYTGRTDAAEREDLEAALKDNQVKALVATSALGMGFDKPDLGFVVHLGAPSSPVAYYQQVGRAGRATDTADVLLLPGREDRDIWEYFATASMPTEEKATAVLTALAEHGGPLSVAALEPRVNIKRSPLELLLKVLAVDGAVERVGGGWQSTGRPWHYDAPRYDRVGRAREAEQRAMLDYQVTDGCRMQFLTRQLDDPSGEPCGRCDVCAGPWYPTDVDPEVSSAADAALHRAGVPLEPRAQWPTGMERLGIRVKGKIPETERAERGRAVARLTDLGWGARLREIFRADANGQPVDSQVTADLGRAALTVLSQWDWQQRPTAVVAMPSQSRPQLVDSLARGIASAGHLPFWGALELNPDVPRGSHGGNSAYRLAEVWDRFTVPPDVTEQLSASGRPVVLLVDDLVDSRWSLTVAAQQLRLAGAEAVLPFVLAAQG